MRVALSVPTPYPVSVVNVPAPDWTAILSAIATILLAFLTIAVVCFAALAYYNSRRFERIKLTTEILADSSFLKIGTDHVTFLTAYRTPQNVRSAVESAYVPVNPKPLIIPDWDNKITGMLNFFDWLSVLYVSGTLDDQVLFTRLARMCVVWFYAFGPAIDNTYLRGNMSVSVYTLARKSLGWLEAHNDATLRQVPADFNADVPVLPSS